MLQADEIFAIKGTIDLNPNLVLKNAKMHAAINFPLEESSVQLLNGMV